MGRRGDYAPPAFELIDIPFRGVARLVPFRGVGLGVRASGLDENDGLNILAYIHKKSNAESLSIGHQRAFLSET